MAKHDLHFKKTGKQIKGAISVRRKALQARLNERNQKLDAFLQDAPRVRSYVLGQQHHHGGRGYVLKQSGEVSVEERDEIDRLCERIREIEEELHRLALIASHLDDDQIVKLEFHELVAYGFEASN